MRYLARRLLHGVLLLVALSVVSFALTALAPGSYFDEMRLDPRVSRGTIEALSARYGLDRPLPVRYARWLGSVFDGELGYSFAYGRPAAPLLVRPLAHTLLLTVVATLLAWLLAVPLGVWSAARAGSWPDRLTAGATSVLLAVPELLVALLLLRLALATGLFPVGGMTSSAGRGASTLATAVDLAWHLCLPVLALVLGALPILVRHVRASVVEVLASAHVAAARGLGIPRLRLLFSHALPAAANPLSSLVGLSIAGLLSGSLLVEVILGWPGLGPILVEAIRARDVYVVVDAVVFSGLFLVVGQLLGDLLLVLSDPQIRMGSR